MTNVWVCAVSRIFIFCIVMLCGSVILCNPNYAMCLSDRLWETSGYRFEHSEQHVTIIMTQMRGHIIIICYCSADVRLVCGFQISIILMGRGWRMINAFKFEFNLILKIILNLTNLEMESRSMIIRKV